MNKLKEDFSRATFKLTMEDLDRPLILLDAFQRLLDEVWRYAPADERDSYARELPFDYVCARFAEQLVGNEPQDEKEGRLVVVLTCLAGRGVEPTDNCGLRLSGCR